MSAWCACHSELFHQEKVLELGSGSDRKDSRKVSCIESGSLSRVVINNSCLFACVVAYHVMDDPIFAGVQEISWTQTSKKFVRTVCTLV